MRSGSAFVVIKFGGTSVSSLANWQNIAAIVKQRRANNLQPIIVCSAPSQVSNLLEQLLQESLTSAEPASFEKILTIYHQLANDLDVDFNTHIKPYFDHLTQVIKGIALIKEVSPRIRAQVLSIGELSLTKMGADYLNRQSIKAHWQDARELLIASVEHRHNDSRHFLAAKCDPDFCPQLAEQLSQLNNDVIVTQGFIASDHHQETVLLGRGGSDVSAAYIAAKLGAKRCEIWTDVPGVYTANPHQIPEARLITQLDYDETQEIASMGAKVLHPNCIPPLKQHQIPLFVKYTPQPDREGTVVSIDTEQQEARIKSIITKKNVLLISIETVKMWQKIGFLAEVFACFKQHKLSIDLISTSQANVTVSLDSGTYMQDMRIIEALITDLNQFAKATIINPCAAISIVGHNIRSILHKLGGIFEVFESQQVHLLSQAANNLNLTFVVDEAQADRIAQRLHALLIEQNPASHYLGKSWQQEFGQYIEREIPWWEHKREQLLQIATEQSPLYVYDRETIVDAIHKVKACDAIDRIFYAMKANDNPDILQQCYQENIGFECVSINEVNTILKLFPDLDRKRILFTPNFAARQEYETALELKINVTVDNMYPLVHWPEVFHNQAIILRIDPGRGAGHHKFVNTGGSDSKFGIMISQLEQVQKIIIEQQITVFGLHAHSGSGILHPEPWQRISLVLTSLLEMFPTVKVINVGGGMGIVEKPGQKPLDLSAVNALLQQVKTAFPQTQLWLEPGRFLVAKSGVILAKVTQTKDKEGIHFVGIETGMNSLIRPALYGSYHEIINLSRFDEPNTITANIVGPICESGDILGYSRMLPATTAGDVVLIANAGAYGHTMSSGYNQRQPAQEYYLK